MEKNVELYWNRELLGYLPENAVKPNGVNLSVLGEPNYFWLTRIAQDLDEGIVITIKTSNGFKYNLTSNHLSSIQALLQ